MESFGLLGHRTLPYRMKRHQVVHTRGTYITMAFAASPTVMEGLERNLAFNEDVIRHSIVKRGESLPEVTGLATPVKGAQALSPRALLAGRNALASGSRA